MIARLQPDPARQFEAARSLRASGWSYFRISQALGITLSQVRVACDPKAAKMHTAWQRARVLGEPHRCVTCKRDSPARDFPQHSEGHGWRDNEGICRRSECRSCKRERDRDRARVLGRTGAQRDGFDGYLLEFEDTRPARVPIGPFAEWLTRKWEQFSALEDGGQEAFAMRLGISPRQLICYLHREREVVLWHTVDKVLVTEGSTNLWELYPDLYPGDMEDAA